MGEINICNSAARDAVVCTESVRSAMRVRWVDQQGRQANSARVLKAPIERGVDALQEKFGGLSQVAEAIRDADPELDLEQTGRFLRETSRIYVDDQ